MRLAFIPLYSKKLLRCLVGAFCTNLRIANSSFALSKLRICSLAWHKNPLTNHRKILFVASWMSLHQFVSYKFLICWCGSCKKNADKRADFRRCRNGTFMLVVLPKVSGEIKNADNEMDARQRRNASFVLGIFSKLSKEIKNAYNEMDARHTRKRLPQFTKRK